MQAGRQASGRYALCDITRKADVERLARTAVDAYGKVDVAVNCTGWGLMARLLETTEEQIDRLTALQFKGPHLFLQVFVGSMAASGGGSVIEISSASVHAPLYNRAAYIGTKAGSDALVRCFANEFGARGVRVNAIAPVLTGTPTTDDEMRMPGLQEAFLEGYPLGRIGTTRDIADAALWLAGDECFMTGQVLQVNGGVTLRRNPSPGAMSSSMREKAAQAARSE